MFCLVAGANLILLLLKSMLYFLLAVFKSCHLLLWKSLWFLKGQLPQGAQLLWGRIKYTWTFFYQWGDIKLACKALYDEHPSALERGCKMGNSELGRSLSLSCLFCLSLWPAQGVSSDTLFPSIHLLWSASLLVCSRTHTILHLWRTFCLDADEILPFGKISF